MSRRVWGRRVTARSWGKARDLAGALAVLALVQLAASLAIVGSLSPGMLAAEVALVLLLASVAFYAHMRRQGSLGQRQ